MNKKALLAIDNLSVSVFGTELLHDINISIEPSTTHVIMGPNGSGKSSLAYAIMGHPDYRINQGKITLLDKDVTQLPIHERARAGIFLAFQNPCHIPGVSVFSFLKEAYTALKNTPITVAEFNTLLQHRCAQLGIDQSFIARSLNEGFSGGEKKRLEMLQLLVLQPRIAILDEIDSGLDIDALKVVAAGLQIARHDNPALSVILITHYRRILQHMPFDAVHILYNGRFVQSGDASLVDRLEAQGYDAFK